MVIFHSLVNRWYNKYIFFLTANVEAVNTTLTSTIIRWTVTSITEEQQYTVVYGTDAGDLSNSSESISSNDSPELTFQVALNGLSQGTMYYVRVVAEFGGYTFMSDVISFTTLEPGA